MPASRKRAIDAALENLIAMSAPKLKAEPKPAETQRAALRPPVQIRTIAPGIRVIRGLD